MKFNRRNFIKSSLIVGASTVASQAAASTESIVVGKTTAREQLASQVTVIQQFENKYMQAKILSNGAFRITDKINNQEWHTFAAAIQDETILRESQLWGRGGRSMGEHYPGRFLGKRENDKIRFHLFGRENRYEGSFVCKFELNDEWLSMQILSVDDSIPSLVFPPPFKCDALVLPIGQGKLLKNTSTSIYSGMYSREYLQFFNSLGMRFIAGLTGSNGWICAYDPKSIDAGAMQINNHITPAWVRSMSKWQGHYKVHFSFTGNGYVGIAKRYRQYTIQQGFFKSLKEKIAANPEAGKLLGGRALQFMQYKTKGYDTIRDDYWATDQQVEVYDKDYINFTFKDVLDKVKIAEQKLGFQKGMVLLRGWMHDGYDASHPDIWPIGKELGTEKAFQDIIDLRDKYLTVLHDNYQDFYPTTKDFPNGVVVRKDGQLMTGGLWFGKQCYITNSRDGVRYAERNLETLKKYNPSGHFIDCVPNNPLHESYEKGNELTRLQDMQNKYKLLQVFHDENMVMGSERFGDFCIPVLHWIEHSQRRRQGETIPLWQLVFHDAVFSGRYNTFEKRSPYPSWIEDMFYGNFLRFWIPVNFGSGEPYQCNDLTGWGSWEYTEKEFKNTYHVDKWHEKIGLQEMTDHAFLTDDMKVEQVIYGGKFKMAMNFDDKPRTVNGREFKAYEYKLES